jgi:hypothetical protein
MPDDEFGIADDPIRAARPDRDRFDGIRVEIVREKTIIAVAEARCVCLLWTTSDGSGDHDFYIALRLVERIAHPIWNALAWRELAVGSMFFRWDHYWTPCSRLPGADQEHWQKLEAAWDTGTLEEFFG